MEKGIADIAKVKRVLKHSSIKDLAKALEYPKLLFQA